jgi:hypothetical protein
MLENRIVKKLDEFIRKAVALGLRPQDEGLALEYLSHNEWGESFDIVAAQLYEYGIEVDQDFFKLALELQSDMQLNADEYAFLEELLNKGSYLEE